MAQSASREPFRRSSVVTTVLNRRHSKRVQLPLCPKHIWVPSQEEFSFSTVKPSTVDQSACLLLNKLPTELREEIYGIVFGDTVVHLCYNLLPDLNPSPFCVAPDVPGLLLACKQMHFDAIRVFYATAIFQFHESVEIRGAGMNRLEWLPPRSTEFWLLRIGSERAQHVKHMRIHIDRKHREESGDRSLSVEWEKKLSICDYSRQAIARLAPKAIVETSFQLCSELYWFTTNTPGSDRLSWIDPWMEILRVSRGL